MASVMDLKSDKAAVSETSVPAIDVGCERIDATRSYLAAPVARKPECPALVMIPLPRGKYQEGTTEHALLQKLMQHNKQLCLHHNPCFACLQFSSTDDPLAMSSTLKLALDSLKLYFVPIT